jgi:ATPase subunit of ABC transporter with duplicated ATPase domains
MTRPFLQLEHVSFNLPDGRVLFDHLSHTFNTRTTGIVGANGCGKSLLGRLLTGEQLPTRGTVRREGRVYAVAQLLDPEHYPTVAALAGVAPILAALERIAQGSVDDNDHSLAIDQWDCAARLEAHLQQIGLGHLHADTRSGWRCWVRGYPGPTG